MHCREFYLKLCRILGTDTAVLRRLRPGPRGPTSLSTTRLPRFTSRRDSFLITGYIVTNHSYIVFRTWIRSNCSRLRNNTNHPDLLYNDGYVFLVCIKRWQIEIIIQDKTGSGFLSRIESDSEFFKMRTSFHF